MIGLATGHRVYNYGTRLQAFAMQSIMEQRGFHAEIIGYRASGAGWKGQIKRMLYSAPGLRDVMEARQREGKLRVYRKGKAPDGVQALVRRRFEAFDRFSRNNLHIRPVCCPYAALGSESKRYQAVFCGSDQAWLPGNIRLKLYTLRFCEKGVRRISYAPSFGVDEVPEELRGAYRTFLTELDSVSVREKRGLELVRELSGREAELVLDPTLLLDRSFWEKKACGHEKRVKEPYIFCYFLGENPAHRSAVKRLAEETGLRIVNIAHMKKYVPADESIRDLEVYDADPFDFVQLIRDADIVCTDSFHCTAFSMQFHRPFYVFRRFAAGNSESTNSRLDSLMGMLGVEDRVMADEIVPVPPIRYDEVDARLTQLRDRSNAYLDKALEGLKE